MNPLNLVVTHLLTTDLAESLKILHDLALYESGDALLSLHEKQALHEVMELARRLEQLTDDDKDHLRSLL